MVACAWRVLLVVTAFASCLLVASPARPMPDASGPRVLRILVGKLDLVTGRFFRLRGRALDSVPRDAVIVVVFSKRVDLDSVNSRTIRVGELVSGGLPHLPEEYSHQRVVRWSPARGRFVGRVRENRVLYDPYGDRLSGASTNPYGFVQDTAHGVSVPGVDSGSERTVTDSEGRPVRRARSLFFRTGDYFSEFN